MAVKKGRTSFPLHGLLFSGRVFAPQIRPIRTCLWKFEHKMELDDFLDTKNLDELVVHILVFFFGQHIMIMKKEEKCHVDFF